MLPAAGVRGRCGERRFTGPRDNAAVSGMLELFPDRSRLHAAGFEWARLRAALVFLRACPAKNPCGAQTGRFRV